MKKVSISETNSNFINSSNISPICLLIQENDKQFKFDDLNLNMIIKYQNEWYAVKLRENTMNDYFLIFRDELKSLKEHLRNYNSFITSIENNTNQVIFKPNEIKIVDNISILIPRAETGIKEEEIPLDENLRNNVLPIIINKFDEEKKILYHFANKEDIDYHYDKLKQIIFKIKNEHQENMINNNNINLGEKNSATNNRSILMNSTLTVINETLQEEIPNVTKPKLSEAKSPLKPDVKVFIEEDNQVDNNINIFSYISDDQIISNLNSNNFDSNNFQINSNIDSRSLNSINPLPNSENIIINTEERLMSNISLIGVKRNNKERLINSIYHDVEINQFDITDNKNKKLKENKINSLFSIRNHSLKLKRFSLNCFDCGVSIKLIKIEKICCDNYLCKMCLMKNYTFLSELIENFHVNKFKIDKCLSAQFQIFFCNFCYLIDKRENLEECSCALCYNLFHKECYETMRIVDRNHLNLNKTEKTRICEEIVSQIIDEEKTKKLILVNEKLKNANIKFLQSCYDSGQLLMILYKFNKCSFYKFFLNYFVRYIIRNKEKFNPNFTNQTQEMVCKNHLCISCLQPIHELNGEEEGFLKICCNNIHKDCCDQENTHLDYIFHKNTSHLPILHFKFIREFYAFVKKISKYNNYHSIEKNDEEKSKTNNCNKNILENQIEILINQDQHSSDSIGLKYFHLTEKEREDVKKSFTEIFTYKISRKLSISMQKKNKTQKGLSKCECLSEIVKCYKNCMIPTTNKRFTNLRSSIGSGENTNKLLKDQNFQDFLKSQGFCCDDLCSNRILKIECFKNTCDCPAEYCLNRYDKSKYYEDFEIIRTSNRGNGLICNRNIKKGEFITQYIGEVIDYSTLIEKSSDINADNYTQWYVMSLDKNLYIDASKYGNKARFINHSCNPNAILEKWLGNGFYNKIFLFAIKDIPAGTEINYNYNFNYFRTDFQQECKCGEKSCCLIMGGNNNIGGNEVVNNLNIVVGSNMLSNTKNNKLIINQDLIEKNPHVILDDNYNVIIDKRILQEYGIDLRVFRRNKNSHQAKGIIMHSYAKENIQEIYREIINTHNIPNNDIKFVNKLKIPFLNKNVVILKNKSYHKIFSSFNNQNNSNFFSKNKIISTLFNEKSQNKFSCRICKSKRGFVKICELCRNSYHPSCVHQYLEKNNTSVNFSLEVDPNFLSCYDCIKLFNTFKRKKIQNYPKFITEDFIKRLKQEANMKSNVKSKITKHQSFINSKINGSFSYSYLILRNDSNNENYAIFNEHEISFTKNRQFQKLHRKFELLRDKGSIQQFQSRVYDIFKSLMKLIIAKEEKKKLISN